MYVAIIYFLKKNNIDISEKAAWTKRLIYHINIHESKILFIILLLTWFIYLYVSKNELVHAGLILLICKSCETGMEWIGMKVSENERVILLYWQFNQFHTIYGCCSSAPLSYWGHCRSSQWLTTLKQSNTDW